MRIFDSASLYIESKQKICDKIVAIDAIIDALLVTALKSAANDDVSEYMLDDGQTKIRTAYKGTEQIAKSIQDFRKIKSLYKNEVNGRVFVLTDRSAFKR